MLNFLLGIWNSSGELTQLVVIVALVYGIVKGVIKIPWINIGNKKKEPHVNMHANCPYFPSLQGLVKEAIKNSTKITVLQYEVFNDQMKEAREFVNDALDKLKTNYLTLYKPYNDGKIAGLLTHSNVKDYYHILDKMKKPLLGKTEAIVKVNHFTEQDEETYRDFVQVNAKKFQKISSEFLNEMYDSDDFKISREELYESNMKLMPVINNIIADYFYKIRAMAQKTKEEIVILEESIKDFV